MPMFPCQKVKCIATPGNSVRQTRQCVQPGSRNSQFATATQPVPVYAADVVVVIVIISNGMTSKHRHTTCMSPSAPRFQRHKSSCHRAKCMPSWNNGAGNPRWPPRDGQIRLHNHRGSVTLDVQIPGDANVATGGRRFASRDAVPDGDPWCAVDAVLTEAFLARGRVHTNSENIATGRRPALIPNSCTGR